MPVYKPRTRTISFRLSEAEYAELNRRSLASGSSSLSDFARLTVRQALGGTSAAAAGMETRVRELKGKTEEIDRELSRLIRVMGQEAIGS